jgi:hypothetical protein
MSYCKSDMTIDQLLADPLIQTVMKADRVDVTQLATMLRTTARGIEANQTSRKNSFVGRLVEMLAAYYGVTLCACIHPGTRFQICKAS